MTPPTPDWPHFDDTALYNHPLNQHSAPVTGWNESTTPIPLWSSVIKWPAVTSPVPELQTIEDPTFLLQYIPDVELLYHGSELIIDSNLRVYIQAPVEPCDLPLDPIVKTTMDLDLLYVYATSRSSPAATAFIEAIQLIRDPILFNSLWLDGEPYVSTRPRRSKMSSSDIEALLEQNIFVEDTCLSTVRCFKVPKKNGLARFILNCVPLNERQLPPPRMAVSSLHVIAENTIQYQHIMTIDAKSFFYQFDLEPSISRHFGLALSNRRGRPTTYRCTRMPMGWKYAPYIAQATANFLLDMLAENSTENYSATVWLDNFIFAANSTAELLEIAARFNRLAATCNLQLHDPVFDAPFLGMEHTWDPSAQKAVVCPSRALLDKASTLAAHTCNPHTLRQRAAAISCGLFIAYMVHEPLGFFSTELSRIGKAVQRSS
ncbi:MAG: hypothetical protein FJ077_12995, partial [Cyanobacteria bacterium K_DeepCast_35m_m2_023]|nr:hypothetical protein [Cyanobacteria bacterium K_DeepCast_35m_m2_023]